MKFLAVIPAKMASTRLPRKNIRKLAGKSLLAWTVDVVLRSKCFSKIVVSSESDEILALADKLKVVGQKRPLSLAVDPAGCINVAQFVVSKLEDQGETYDYVAILMPTCPFKSSDDIKTSTAMIDGLRTGCVFSVSEFSHTPYNSLTIENGNLIPILPYKFGHKTQELPTAYRPNGAIFIMPTMILKKAKSLYPKPMRPYVMPEERSIDIDIENDMQLAEFMLSQQL